VTPPVGRNRSGRGRDLAGGRVSVLGGAEAVLVAVKGIAQHEGHVFRTGLLILGEPGDRVGSTQSAPRLEPYRCWHPPCRARWRHLLSPFRRFRPVRHPESPNRPQCLPHPRHQRLPWLHRRRLPEARQRNGPLRQERCRPLRHRPTRHRTRRLLHRYWHRAVAPHPPAPGLVLKRRRDRSAHHPFRLRQAPRIRHSPGRRYTASPLVDELLPRWRQVDTTADHPSCNASKHDARWPECRRRLDPSARRSPQALGGKPHCHCIGPSLSRRSGLTDCTSYGWGTPVEACRLPRDTRRLCAAGS